MRPMCGTRPLRARLAALLTAIATALSLATVLTAPAAGAATFADGAVTEAPDYATTVFKDPWDFSNPDDLLLDNSGPAMGLAAASITGGLADLRINPGTYISPLWTGYPGAQLLGRDGALQANHIDASYYTRLHLRVYASQSVSAGAFWFTCEGQDPACWGGMPFGIPAGWSDIDVKLANEPALIENGKEWTGNITGLRIGMNPTSATDVKIDFIRVYHPGAANVTWNSPAAGQGARLFWSDGTAYPITQTRNGGPVLSPSGAATVGGTGRTTTDLSGYPAGTVFYAVADDGSITPAGDRLRLAAQPRPIIDSPTAAGCGDYATTTFGHPWTFNSLADLGGYNNITDVSFANGAITATNGPPHRVDPQIYLKLAPGGLDGRIWNRFTIIQSYQGPFDLAERDGGGTMARVIWHNDGQTNVAQTNDLVTYTGVRTLTIDLGRPGAEITDPDGGPDQRYSFAGNTPVTQLRWDPNEDSGPRRWTVYSARLATTCASPGGFAITWHDDGFTAGSTATVSLVPQSGGPAVTVAASVPQTAGGNLVRVQAGLPEGRYLVRVAVTSPAGSTATATSSGPLDVKFFRDVAPGGGFTPDIQWLVDTAITSGYDDGTFRPGLPIDRQAMAAYLYRYVHGGDDAGACAPGTSPFRDVADSNLFCGDIKWLSESGITTGFDDGTFRPGEQIERQAIAAFLYRMQHNGAKGGACTGTAPFRDVSADSQFCVDIGWLATTTPQAITTGWDDGTFRPGANIERQAMAAFLHRYELDFAGYGKG